MSHLNLDVEDHKALECKRCKAVYMHLMQVSGKNICPSNLMFLDLNFVRLIFKNEKLMLHH